MKGLPFTKFSVCGFGYITFLLFKMISILLHEKIPQAQLPIHLE